MKTIKVRTQYYIVGGDYSAQEPRLLTHLSGDKTFRDIFESGKDPYASISSLMFKKDYWECMEHWEDGSPNPEGKKLRKKLKTIMLGISYGMGAKLLSKNLGTSVDECKDLLNQFYDMFPSIKSFTDENDKSLKENGYVEDYVGRRRHLNDVFLDELDIIAKKKISTNCDMLMNCSNADSTIEVVDKERTDEWKKAWLNSTDKSFELKTKFKDLAKNNGIEVHDNGAFISKTHTQCTNARIQGSALTLTKKAMIKILTDRRMQEIGFKILIPVHDELLGECPEEYAEEAEERLLYLMAELAKPECSVLMKIDTYRVKHWYMDEVNNEIYKDYNKHKNSEMQFDELLYLKFCDKYPEIPREYIKEMCIGTFDTSKEIQ